MTINPNKNNVNLAHNPLSAITRVAWMANAASMVLATVVAVLGQRGDHDEYHRFMVYEVFPDGKTRLLVERVGQHDYVYNVFSAVQHFGAIPRDYIALDALIKAYNALPKTA